MGATTHGSAGSMVVRSRWMGGVGMDETGELRDQCRYGKGRVPEQSAATRRQGQFGNSTGREKKGWRAGDAENRIASLRAHCCRLKENVRLSEATSRPETTAPPSYLEYKNTKTVLS